MAWIMKRFIIGLAILLVVVAAGCIGGGTQKSTTSGTVSTVGMTSYSTTSFSTSSVSPTTSTVTTTSVTSQPATSVPTSSTSLTTSTTYTNEYPATLTWPQKYAWTSAGFTQLNTGAYSNYYGYSVIEGNKIYYYYLWSGTEYSRTITGRTYFEIHSGTYLGNGTYVLTAWLPTAPNDNVQNGLVMTAVYSDGTLIATYGVKGTWVATIKGVSPINK